MIGCFQMRLKRKLYSLVIPTDISSMVKDALNPKNMQLIRKIFLEDRPTHFYMHNYHLLNHYIANWLKNIIVNLSITFMNLIL
jgi:hypothetical protein